MNDLDYKKVRSFWENRYTRKNITGDLYVANLSDNIPLQAKYKDLIEKELISHNVRLEKNMRVLDLGCGSGRMLVFFAQKCGFVVGVDFSKSLFEIADKNIKNLELKNVSLIQQSIFDFYIKDKFDIILIGGVLSYLNDREVEKVLLNIKDMLKKNGVLIVRDSLSCKKRQTLKEKYMDNFKDNYNVVYRTIKEFKYFFEKNMFCCDFEKSLSVFPFMGLYHYMFRKLLGKGKIYSVLSKGYFETAYYFIFCIYWYRNTNLYKLFSFLINRYDQKLFIFRPGNGYKS